MNNSRKLTCILLLLFLFISSEGYSRYIFRNLDVSNGLSDNTVRCITQDEQGFIWFGTFNGLCRFDGTNFQVFTHSPNDSTSVISNNISAVLAVEGGLWVGTDSGLDFFSIKDNCFYRSQRIGVEGDKSIFCSQIKAIFHVDQRLFVLGETGGLFVCQKGKLFKQYIYDDKHYWFSVCHYKDNYLLMHSSEGLYLFDIDTEKIISYLSTKSKTKSNTIFYSENQDLVYVGYGIRKGTEIYKINAANEIVSVQASVPANASRIVDYGDETLIGTDGKGLCRIHDKEMFFYITDNSTISSDVIQSLFVDREKNLWIGTYRDGVNLYSDYSNRFSSLTVGNKQLTHKLVTAVTIRGQELYLGLDGGGLNIYNQSSGKLTSYTTHNSDIATDNVLSIVDDKQYIWLGAYLGGVCRFSPQSKQFKTYPLPPNASIWDMKDDGKYIWVIGRSVYLFDKESGDYMPIENLQTIWASDVVWDKNAIWVSSGSGIYKLDRENKTILKHYSKESDQYPLPDNDIAYMFIDTKHRVWFSVRNSGLFKLEENDTFTAYGEKDGLTEKNISAMQEDANGYLWIGTNNGLFRFNPQTGTFVRFGKEDNLPSAQINHNACFREGDRLYFGSTNGLIYFNSSRINYNRTQSHIYIGNIELLNNGEMIHINRRDKKEAIELAYNQNFFTISFATPEFISPDKVHFSCRMENFEEEWRNVKTDRQVTYTNIPPGKYTFCVRQLDREGKWSEEISTLEIKITPPWWRTDWATCLWIVLTMGIIFLIYLFFRHEARIKQIAREKEMEKNMVKKDNDMKLRFFTNISHEFRTPLSLIISPLEILIKNETDQTLRGKLSNIHKNAGSLLNLVNQLLDFRKLEMNGEKLHLMYGDLIEFTDSISHSFKETAQNARKELLFSTDVEHLYMSFDKDKVRKILNNLLSNAFKYTPEGASITLSINKVREGEHEYASIHVADTGIGIPEDKLSHIFERFYQLENSPGSNTGSGIGLHLVKEYVDLHSGKITVESALNKGTTFTVWIPVDLEKQSVAEVAASEAGSQQQETEPVNEHERATLLIVEDNSEFRQFLVEQLEAEFCVIQAADGEEGEQMALKESPDLILTDIMMPKVDGVELCKRIKTNIQTSHIPVILLTARASNEFIMTGYEAGADEYISKPFNFDILLLRIRKLLEQQRERKAQFKESIEIKPNDITITSLDEKLIQDALQAIEKNMNNTEYSVENLSDDVGLSRRGLYKKIQSITGETPSNFIRSIRLKRAAQLLRDSDLQVTEIADHVGFGNIKYFNKHFKEEFNVTPTQYRKDVKN